MLLKTQRFMSLNVETAFMNSLITSFVIKAIMDHVIKTL